MLWSETQCLINTQSCAVNCHQIKVVIFLKTCFPWWFGPLALLSHHSCQMTISRGLKWFALAMCVWSFRWKHPSWVLSWIFLIPLRALSAPSSICTLHDVLPQCDPFGRGTLNGLHSLWSQLPDLFFQFHLIVHFSSLVFRPTRDRVAPPTLCH